MKKIKLALVAMTLVMLWSCGKYEEGPAFSLRSKKSRIAGTWVYDKVLQDGVDVTSESNYSSYELTIEKDGTYKTVFSYTFLGQTISGEDSGTWEFGDNETIDVKSTTNNTTTTSTITRLTNSEYWTKRTSTDGTVTEVHYKSK